MFGHSEPVENPDIMVASKDGARVCLQGSINIDSAPALRDGLVAFLRSPHPSVVNVDLSRVNHIDSSGVATLIEALKIARGARTQLRLEGLHDRLLRVFEATGILAIFNSSVQPQTPCEGD